MERTNESTLKKDASCLEQIRKVSFPLNPWQESKTLTYLWKKNQNVNIKSQKWKDKKNTLTLKIRRAHTSLLKIWAEDFYIWVLLISIDMDEIINLRH